MAVAAAHSSRGQSPILKGSRVAVVFFLWMPTISAHLQDWEAPPAGSIAEGARLMVVLMHFRTHRFCSQHSAYNSSGAHSRTGEAKPRGSARF